MSDTPPAAEDVLAVRRAKLARLRERGVTPFALRFDPDATAAEVRSRHDGIEDGASTGETVRMAGRLMALRAHGSLSFGVLRDGTGDLQLFLQRDRLGEEAFAALEDLDIGDWLGVEGEVLKTKKGELSVAPASVTILSKSLRPLPEKWHGLKDTEIRYRQRYLDMLSNPEVAARVSAKARLLASMRAHLDAKGFVEVETPALQTIPGGGLARPFVTHHNALDIDLYLRIAPELFLKRLLVGGMERVYEIGRNFRNEGIDRDHNTEFTMLEAYHAYWTYEDMMELVEGLVKDAAMAVAGSLQVAYRGEPIDLDGDWPRRTVLELVSEHVGREVSLDTPLEDLQRIADEREVGYDPAWAPGQLLAELFGKLVEHTLMGPVFVKDFPREVSPLARPHRDDPRLTEHFDLILGGLEIAPAYSELTDPDEQRDRFELQQRQAAAGDEEAHPYDREFITALEHGMPPAGGMGLGIDRLLMVLTDAPSLREVILFPTMRPDTQE